MPHRETRKAPQEWRGLHTVAGTKGLFLAVLPDWIVLQGGLDFDGFFSFASSFWNSVLRRGNDQGPGDLNENSVKTLQEKGLRDLLHKEISCRLI